MRVVATYGSSRSIVAGFGVERSMWQRHTQCRAFSGHERVSAAGCGSWTSTTSQPSDELAGVHLVVASQTPTAPSVRSCGCALQRVVHQLRRVEELLAPVDDLPLGVEADVAHQRHERVEDLRHAAAERGRRDVDDAQALERLGERADLLDSGRPTSACSRRGYLCADVDGLEHAAEPTDARPRRQYDAVPTPRDARHVARRLAVAHDVRGATVSTGTDGASSARRSRRSRGAPGVLPTPTITSPPARNGTPWKPIVLGAGPQTRPRRGPPALHVLGRRRRASAPRPKRCASWRIDVASCRHAEVRVARLAGRAQLAERAAHGVDRHREADARALAARSSDLRGDAEHAAARVEQRPAGVAVVDRGVGLDRARRSRSRSATRSSGRGAEITPTDSDWSSPNGRADGRRRARRPPASRDRAERQRVQGQARRRRPRSSATSENGIEADDLGRHLVAVGEAHVDVAARASDRCGPRRRSRRGRWSAISPSPSRRRSPSRGRRRRAVPTPRRDDRHDARRLARGRSSCGSKLARARARSARVADARRCVVSLRRSRATVTVVVEPRAGSPRRDSAVATAAATAQRRHAGQLQRERRAARAAADRQVARPCARRARARSPGRGPSPARRRRCRTARRSAAGRRAGSRRRSRVTASRTLPSCCAARRRRRRCPRGVWVSALSSRMRRIWATRSGSHVDPIGSPASRSSRWESCAPSARGELAGDGRGERRRCRSARGAARASRRPAARGRAGRWRASCRRSTCSRSWSMNWRRVSSSRSSSSSSSRKPPSEKIGVRSSCEAVAMKRGGRCRARRAGAASSSSAAQPAELVVARRRGSGREVAGRDLRARARSRRPTRRLKRARDEEAARAPRCSSATPRRSGSGADRGRRCLRRRRAARVDDDRRRRPSAAGRTAAARPRRRGPSRPHSVAVAGRPAGRRVGARGTQVADVGLRRVESDIA